MTDYETKLREAVEAGLPLIAGPCPYDNKHSHPFGACPDRVISKDTTALDAYRDWLRADAAVEVLERYCEDWIYLDGSIHQEFGRCDPDPPGEKCRFCLRLAEAKATRSRLEVRDA